MLDKCPEDVLEELGDEEYKSRTHGTRGTYAKGCHGPLCRKSERDRGKPRYVLMRAQEDKEVRPTESEHPSRERDRLLDQIINWHRYERGLSAVVIPDAPDPINMPEEATA